MKRLPKSIAYLVLMIIALTFLSLLISGCGSTTIYWGHYVHTASGKHYKQKRGWGYYETCVGMDHGQYQKEKSIRRYQFKH